MPKFDDEDEKKDRHVTRGRMGRFLKLSGLTTRVGASMIGEKVLGSVLSEDRKAERNQKAMEKHAARAVQVMGEMKGAAMKLGQMLSTAPLHAEELPDEIKDALAVLQREAPPMPWEMVTRQVERAFDRPIHDVFRYFSPEPIAAASIGQVHEAESFDGQRLAVKIQYPDVAETLESDLKNLASLANLGKAFAGQRVDEVMEEIREVLLTESDYEAEAANLERLGSRLSVRPDVRVPKPIHELTRRTVLSMEFIEGEKLDTWLLAQPPDVRNEKAIEFVWLFAWMFHDLQMLHADPHPGNFLIDEEGRYVLLDFGAVREFEADFTDGFLELLACVWEGEPERLPGIYEDLGFGGDDGVEVPWEVIEGWVRITLEPFFQGPDFDFRDWDPKPEARKYFMKNMELMKLTPPKEAIFYGRVCAGCWGFLQRIGVKGNFQGHAQVTARERGVYRGDIRGPVRAGEDAPVATPHGTPDE